MVFFDNLHYLQISCDNIRRDLLGRLSCFFCLRISHNLRIFS
nr:MAG TPA: hypothetical protein [Caudoviricetes sp.]